MDAVPENIWSVPRDSVQKSYVTLCNLPYLKEKYFFLFLVCRYGFLLPSGRTSLMFEAGDTLSILIVTNKRSESTCIRCEDPDDNSKVDTPTFDTPMLLYEYTLLLLSWKKCAWNRQCNQILQHPIDRQMSVSSRLVVFYLYKRSENASERAGWCMGDMDDLPSSGRRYCFKKIKSSGSSTYPPCKYFKKPNSHSQYIFILSIHVKIRSLLSKLWIKIFRSRLIYVN